MTAKHGVLRVRLRGPLLVGGVSPPPPGVDASTALDASGRPFIPASALRGALREAVLRLANTENPEEPACSPSDARPGCTCAVCRLFGSPGTDRPELSGGGRSPEGQGWGAGALRVGDATLAKGAEAPLNTRRSVSIDRRLGRARDGRYFQRQVAEGAGATLEAPLTVRLSAEDVALLGRALPLVDGIGNSVSRGLGHVEVAIEWAAAAPRQVVVELPKPTDAPMRVVVTAREPLHLGMTPDLSSHRGTLRFIPGAALLGALHAAAPGEHRPAFWSEVSLSDLWPGNAAGPLPTAAPRSFLWCATCATWVDSTLTEALARAFAERGLTTSDEPTCPAKHPLKGRSGVLPDRAVATRIVTRLSRDPARGTFSPGMLYSREQIEPGATFVGTAAPLTPRARAALEAIARAGSPVLLGAGRTRGMGSISVSFASVTDDVGKRVRAWRDGLAAYRPAAQAAGWAVDQLVLVVARTPLALPEGSAPGDWLGAELFDGKATLRAAWQRSDERAGWDDRDGAPRRAVSVARAGSAWLFQLSVPVDGARLLRAETEGVGLAEHRRLGLNRLTFCPTP